MKIKLLPLPHVVIESDTLPVRGKAKLLVIWLRNDLTNRERTYKHELTHVLCFYAWGLLSCLAAYLTGVQWFYIIAPALHSILLFVPHYRFVEECLAHSVSATYDDRPHEYIRQHSAWLVDERSGYKRLHRFSADTAKRLMLKFYGWLI